MGATASSGRQLGQVLGAHTISDFAQPSTGGSFWHPLAGFHHANAPFATFRKPKSPSNPNETELTGLDQDVAAAINNFRVAHGLNALTISDGLTASAQQHSMEMGAKGYFDHDSFNGTTWWKRIENYYSSDGYDTWTVGENLLFATDYISAANAMKMWIASPDHLRNLKDPNWRNLGVSAVHVLNAPGVYSGYDVTIITTDFGARH